MTGLRLSVLSVTVLLLVVANLYAIISGLTEMTVEEHYIMLFQTTPTALFLIPTIYYAHVLLQKGTYCIAGNFRGRWIGKK